MSNVPHPPPSNHPRTRLDELRAEYGGCDLSRSPEARRAKQALANHGAKAARCLERIADLLALYLVELNKAREFLAQEGYDPAYGARPLKRAIQSRVQDPLALMLLEGKFAEGDTVVVDLAREGERLVIRKK